MGLGNQAKYIVPADLAETEHAIVIIQILSQLVGIALWGLSLWFFLVSVGSLFKYLRPAHRAKMHFQMTWFSFVFPNTALVNAPIIPCSFLAGIMNTDDSDQVARLR